MRIFSSKFYKEDLETSKQLLLEALARVKHPLIFADNYETISDKGFITDDSRKINSFLESVPSNVRIILTSRHRRNLAVEYSYHVPGLTQDEGVDLFVQISKQHFIKTPSKNIIKEIRKISTELGGHPLSIRLLAGSYNGGGISEIQNMLVSILMNTENELEEQKRLRSINNCFNYSFDRLNDKSKEALLDLCLFNSPFLKSVTDTIFDLDEGMLFDLFNRSFIFRVELEGDPDLETRHILYDFHPIIKRYLREKPNEKRLFLQTEVSKRFTLNYDGIACVIYDMLCELNYGIPSQLRFDLSLLNAFNLITRHKNNDFEQAIKFSGSQESKSFLATRLSRIMALEGLFGGSLYYAQKLLEIDIGIGDPIGLLLDYYELGNIFAAIDNLERSLEYYQKALDILIRVNKKQLFAGSKGGDILIPVNANKLERIFVSPLPVDRNKTLGGIYSSMGDIYRTKGDLDKALEYHTKAYRLCRNAAVYSDIANVLYDKGNLRNALSYHHMALKLDKKNNDTVGMAHDYLALGNTVLRMRDIVKALEYYNKALELYQQIHNKHGMITAYKNIAIILEFNGNIQKSIEYKEKAKELELIVSSIDNNYDIFSSAA